MMASETQVKALMGMIDLALTEAGKIEKRLNSYDEILLYVKDSIEKMAEKNFFIEQTNANNRKLLDTLEHLIVSVLVFFLQEPFLGLCSGKLTKYILMKVYTIDHLSYLQYRSSTLTPMNTWSLRLRWRFLVAHRPNYITCGLDPQTKRNLFSPDLDYSCFW